MAVDAQNLSTADLEFVCELLRREASIVLTATKRYLVQMRLNELAKEQGCPGPRELVQTVRSAPYGPMTRKVVESLTINETLFFRDEQAFQHLRTSVLPHLIERNSGERELSIWCGACSTGQEPYSLLMMLEEHFPVLRSWKLNFLASDVDQSVLDRATEGVYDQFEVNRGLPARLLVRYFERVERKWRIKADLRNRITFRRVNLAGAWGEATPVDLMLLRHVLIYFEDEVRRGILERVAARMKPHGRLILGASEISHPTQGLFQAEKPGTGCFTPLATR